jgi:hypothetical protein
MDSYQKRTEAQIEKIAEDAGYTVSRDASYGNVGTLRFHDGDSVEALHFMTYSFQNGYASLKIDEQEFGGLYYYGRAQGRTISDFLALLEDELTSHETPAPLDDFSDAGEIAGSLAGSSAGEIAGKNAGLREALAQQKALAESLARSTDVITGSEAPAVKRHDDCILAGTHKIVPDDNNWCRTCDTGKCPDCGEPTTWVDDDGWYRHIDPKAAPCFLIQTASPYAEAREAFQTAVTAFIDAGNRMVDAWDRDGFHADQSYPLPERLAPPMSFDEWFAELSEHYARIEA